MKGQHGPAVATHPPQHLDRRLDVPAIHPREIQSVAAHRRLDGHFGAVHDDAEQQLVLTVEIPLDGRELPPGIRGAVAARPREYGLPLHGLPVVWLDAIWDALDPGTEGPRRRKERERGITEHLTSPSPGGSHHHRLDPIGYLVERHRVDDLAVAHGEEQARRG